MDLTFTAQTAEHPEGSPPPRATRLVEDSARTFLYRILMFALILLNGVVVARALAPADKGAYNLAVALPRLLIRFGNLGIGAAAIYQIGKGGQAFKRIAGNALGMGLIIGALLTGLAIVAYGPLSASFLKGVNPVLFYMAVGTIALALMADFAQDLLRGARDIRNFNRSRISHYVFLLTGTTTLLLALRLGTPGAMLAWIMTVVGEVTLALLLLRRHAPLSLRLDRDLIGAMAGFGLRAYVMQFVMFLNYDLDIFIVNHFALDTSSVGFYSLAAGLAETLWYFPNAVTIVLFPNIAADLKRGGELTPKACRHVLFLTLGSSLALGLAAPIFLPLIYGERYSPAIAPLLLLLPGVVALSVFKVLSTGLFGRGQPMLASRVALAGLAAQIGMDFLLIPRLGIHGAALASTLAYSLMSVLGVLVYSRAAGVSARDMLILKRDDWRVYGKLAALPWKRLRRGAPRQRIA